ncbi:hypothetical protein PoB_003467000 [Plakobranchus ocellatus]|uniref:Uncharacterized protein n=1 Tax=Plakobranchus ocellatus TaxID=259542 RepID=A0AAV4ALC1_9GAST|nr:hypothetical protein PoB_003467000 [Plakobranchus ocellatus]
MLMSPASHQIPRYRNLYITGHFIHTRFLAIRSYTLYVNSYAPGSSPWTVYFTCHLLHTRVLAVDRILHMSPPSHQGPRNRTVYFIYHLLHTRVLAIRP